MARRPSRNGRSADHRRSHPLKERPTRTHPDFRVKDAGDARAGFAGRRSLTRKSGWVALPAVPSKAGSARGAPALARWSRGFIASVARRPGDSRGHACKIVIPGPLVASLRSQ